MRPLASVGRFYEARSAHITDVFFMYVGDDDPNNDLYVSTGIELTHYQTTNFRLFQTEGVCRRQFQI